MKIKRITVLFFCLLLFLVNMVGCTFSSTGNYNNVAKDNILIVLESIQNEDASAIAALFCPYVKETCPDLEEQIKDWMSVIDGDIVSYDEPTWSLGTGMNTEKEGIVELSFGGEIDNMKTSTGRIYRIGCGGYSVNKAETEYEGVSSIVIFAKEVYIPGVGHFEEEVYRIEFPEVWE